MAQFQLARTDDVNERDKTLKIGTIAAEKLGFKCDDADRKKVSQAMREGMVLEVVAVCDVATVEVNVTVAGKKVQSLHQRKLDKLPYAEWRKSLIELCKSTKGKLVTENEIRDFEKKNETGGKHEIARIEKEIGSAEVSLKAFREGVSKYENLLVQKRAELKKLQDAAK